MKLSVIIPSRTRPAMLTSVIGQLRQTPGLEIIVVADDCEATFDCAKDADLVILNNKRLGAVASWNKGASQSSGDFLMLGSDDMQPQGDWLATALKAHSNVLMGYGLVGLNDLMHNGNEHAVHVIFDRQFCKDHLGGVLAVPHYYHLFFDKELNIRAKRSGKFTWCRDAVMAHLHPANDTRKADELDKERVNWWAGDEAIFLDRQMRGFPNDFEPVL